MSYFTSTIYLSTKAATDTANTAYTSATITPLRFKDATDTTIDYKQKKITYRDGVSIYRNNCCVNLKDVKNNNSSLLWLTSSQDMSVMFESEVNLDNIGDYLEEFGFIYCYIRTLVPNASTTNNLFYLTDGAVANSVSEINLTLNSIQSNIFKIELNNNSKYNISISGKYLTADIDTYECTLQALDPFTSNIQEFDLTVEGNNFFIFFKDPNSTDQEVYRYIGIDSTENIKAFGIYSSSSTSRYDQVSVTDSLTGNRHTQYSFQLYAENTDIYSFGPQFEKNNSWVKYYADIQNKDRLKSVEIDEDETIDNVPVNYLLVSPYEANIDLSDEAISVTRVPLKNMLTPENNYAITPWTNQDGDVLTSIDEELKPKQREYHKIFCGDSDQFGYDTPVLTFTSNTKLVKLDEDAYFHYPFEASQLDLSASGLIEAGAIAGDSPINSDRIFKKNAGYGDYIYWGDSLQPQSCPDGVWLCSWLSGSLGSSLTSVNEKVWVDRWYDPSKLTIGDALALGYKDYTLQIYPSAFEDVHSNMTLDPGVQYRYTRMNTDQFVSSVNTLNVLNSALRLHFIDDWVGEITDSSDYKNNGEIIGSGATERSFGPSYGALDQSMVYFNDDSFIQVPYNDTLNLSGSQTITTFAYSDNWKNNPGSSIVMTGFRGGASVQYNNHFFNPIVSVIEDTYAHVLQYSQCAPIADTRISTE